MNRYVLDTNIFLINPNAIELYEQVIIPLAVYEELDGIKKDEGTLGWKARHALSALDKATNIVDSIFDFYDIDIFGWDKEKRDNQIVYCGKVHDAIVVSNDTAVRKKASALGLSVEKYEVPCNLDYTGYVEVYMDDEEKNNSEWYKNNKWNLNVNEYLLIRDIKNKNKFDEKGQSIDKVIDMWTWTKDGFRLKNYPKRIESSALGKFVCKDAQQEAVLDSFYNNKMTMVKGKAGTGKSLLALSYAMSQIEKGKYDKLIVFCNPVATKNAVKLGFLPGSQFMKLEDSSVGHMLSSKFGSRLALETLVRQEKVILLPFSDLRGFDSTGMKAICWFVEAQNLDIELMKLAIQRIGDDCQIIIDGDYNAQVDSCAYEGSNNGMRRVSEVFRGIDFYGEVELKEIYRSRMAKIADKL
jgi:predicted ribonuclease YlaK